MSACSRCASRDTSSGREEEEVGLVRCGGEVEEEAELKRTG